MARKLPAAVTLGRRGMSTYHLALPAALLARARARARQDGTTLADVLEAYLEAYAASRAPGQAGGRARAATLSQARRSEIARAGGKARWKETE